MMQQPTILGLDVGSKRIGVAIASTSVHFANPLATLDHNEDIWHQLKEIVVAQAVSQIVVGLPRGLEGQETAQTRSTRDFARTLKKELELPVELQDEALTSVKAEEELESRGKPYIKGDVDALAATYILEDYLVGQREAV